MTAEYIVTMKRTDTYQVKVTAGCEDEAQQLALKEMNNCDDPDAEFLEASTGAEVTDWEQVI